LGYANNIVGNALWGDLFKGAICVPAEDFAFGSEWRLSGLDRNGANHYPDLVIVGRIELGTQGSGGSNHRGDRTAARSAGAD
jgi:hypothetical protein